MTRELKFMSALLISALLLLTMSGCSSFTCRHDALNHSFRLEQEHLETAIAAYKIGTLGRIAGLGLWDFHCEAVYFQDGKWHWTGFGDRPYFTPADDIIIMWQPEYYRAAVEHYEATGEKVVPEMGWWVIKGELR